MDGDLTLSVRLKADGSGFVGAVRVSRQELDKFGRGAVESGRNARRLGDGMDHARNRALLLKTAIIALVTGGTARLAKSFIDAADESEGYRVRLVRLLRDQGEANRLFAEAAELAGRLPFEYRAVMNSATTLSGVLRGGADEVMDFLPLIGDLAAVTGLTFEQTTEQVVRMVSAGAASADLFRERGVLAMLGFQAGVTTSARETRERLFEEWNKADSQFRGAAGDLAQTWTGLMSMFGDKWFQFRNQVMDAGPFDFLKSNAAELLERIESLGMEDAAERLGRNIEEVIEATLIGAGDAIDAITPVMKALQDGVNTAIRGYNQLPPIVQEVGLFGVLFFGRKFALVGALALGLIEDFERRRKEAYERARSELQQQNGVTLQLEGGTQAGENGGVTLNLRDHVQGPSESGFKSLYDQLNDIATGGGSRLGEMSLFGDTRGGVGDAIRDFLADARMRRTNAVDELDMFEGSAMREASGANVRAKPDQPQAAVDFVTKGLRDIIPAYDRAVQEANAWKREAMKGLDETAAGYDEFATLVEDVYQQRLAEAYEEGLRASKKWEDGVERAFLDYQRQAADMATAAEDLLVGSFKRAEDAVIEFAKTGKIELGDLFEFILDELLRIQIRKQIVGVFGDLDLAGAIGDIFSGQGSGVQAGPPAPDVSTVGIAHSGGVIGRDALGRRAVHPGVFAGAPRFHRGGLVGDERAIIARKGEGVFTPAQMAAMGGAEVNVQVINNSGAEAQVSERPNGRGGRDVIVTIGEAMARDVRSRGPLGRAIEQTFGAGRTLASR